jgi:hypothetical protein
MSSGLNDRPLAPFAGILSLGIGDTMVSSVSDLLITIFDHIMNSFSFPFYLGINDRVQVWRVKMEQDRK